MVFNSKGASPDDSHRMTDHQYDIDTEKTTEQSPGLLAKKHEFLAKVNASLILFAVCGFILTFAAFFALDVYIQRLVQHDYEQVTKNTVEVLAKGFEELENSIETVATILSLADDKSEKITDDRINQSIPNIAKFDQILLLFPKKDSMPFEIIQTPKPNLENFDAYTIPVTRKMVEHIYKGNYFSNSAVKMLMNKDLFQMVSRGMYKDISLQPFAFVKPINVQRPSDGLIVGITNAGAVLDYSWIKSNEIIARLSIRDLSVEQTIYDFNFTNTQEFKVASFSQVYEFDIAGHQWEIRLGFFKEQKTYFLEIVPYLVLIFGVVLTFFGTIYMRNNQRQALRLRRMNAMLGIKNRELKSAVSKQEHLNQSLEKSERQNRAILDAVNDVIFEAAPNGKILFLNETWEKITGIPVQQSVGIDLFSMIHPQEVEQQRHEIHRLVEGRIHDYRSFLRVRTLNGTFHATEMAISMVQRDDEPRLRIVGTLTSVEDRRRAERALMDAEKKYRTIVENAAGGIYQLTPEGIYLSANPALARILGYDSPESLLRDVKNAHEQIYVNPRGRQSFLRELNKRGSIANYEAQVIRKDGAKIWVSENARVVADDGGDTLYYEGSMEDITERKNSDIALREAKFNSDLANRAKSEFLANMSHELRTPLNAIIGFSEIIYKEVFGEIDHDAYKDYAKDINESGQNLLKVINEILDISKIEASERQLNEGIVDIGETIKTCVQILRSKADENDLSVEVQASKLPHLIGEDVAVKQIIMNVLSNAVKFTPKGGKVTIGANINVDGGMAIHITDTGVGLDEAEIEKALSPFGQVNSAFSRSHAGTGLGLTLVDALVRLHGGNLEILSQKGIGTTVSIVFPKSRVQTVSKSAAVRSGAGNQIKA
jgi:PAS domain S-box-containing protein